MSKHASIYDPLMTSNTGGITFSSKFIIYHPVLRQALSTTILCFLNITILTFLAFASSAYASDNPTNKWIEEDRYITSKKGCYVWQPTQAFGDTVSWTGSCQDGYAEGEGVAKWYNNKQLASIYTGNFVGGKLKGLGHIKWKIKKPCDPEYYEGELKNSDPFNQGKVYFGDGSIYTGQFFDDGITSKGTKIYGQNSGREGDRYEGESVNFDMHGFGIYMWGSNGPWSGDIYVGESKQGKFNGNGVYTSANGDRYKGEWKNGARSGEGTMVYADGIVYKGGWENWLRSGYGEIDLVDGSTYKGFWKNDIADGYGKITYTNGNFYEGDVFNLQRHGKGKTIYEQGTEQGTYVFGQRQGDFTRKSKNGGHMQVIFEDNKVVSGTQTRANGIVYSGAWRNRKAWGYGHLTSPRSAFNSDKRAKNGVWEGDTFVEKGWFYDDKFKFPCDNHHHCVAVANKHPEWQQYMD